MRLVLTPQSQRICHDPENGAAVADPEKALAGALDDWWWLECVVKLPDQIGN